MDKIIIINKNWEFRRAYQRGKSYVSPTLVLYVLRNHKKHLRIGITTSKKVGNAVERNRARRVIMESLRAVLPKLSGGYDLVFVARSKASQVKSTQVLTSMEKMLATAGLLPGEAGKNSRVTMTQLEKNDENNTKISTEFA